MKRTAFYDKLLHILLNNTVYYRFFQVQIKKRGVILAVTGIIAEFNPLHLGHKHIIDCARGEGNTVVALISGNFVQRGDTAIISKQKRAEAALLCGADIVAELPVLWSMSTAQNFALGGVWQLYCLGCDEILFGSECGDIERLKGAADVLNSDEFHSLVSEKMSAGITFAQARQSAAEELGVDTGLLESPNDNLGIEYISAAKRLNLPIEFRCVKRVGAGHDSQAEVGGYVSASLIRKRLLCGEIGFAERYMPRALRGFIRPEYISDIKRLETAILAVLRTRTEAELKCLPDISEGIENKLFFSVRVAKSLDELYNMVKTKRYTMARVRRLVLSAFLGLDSEFFMTTPPYVRLLGFSDKGQVHLKATPSFVPIVTRSAQIKELDAAAQRVFEVECRASDLYTLSLEVPLECGAEYKSKFLKVESLK